MTNNRPYRWRHSFSVSLLHIKRNPVSLGPALGYVCMCAHMRVPHNVDMYVTPMSSNSLGSAFAFAVAKQGRAIKYEIHRRKTQCIIALPCFVIYIYVIYANRIGIHCTLPSLSPILFERGALCARVDCDMFLVLPYEHKMQRTAHLPSARLQSVTSSCLKARV